LGRYRPEDKSLYSQELSTPIPSTSQFEVESTPPFEEIDEDSDIYEALSSYLQKIPEAERYNIQMTFKEIEEIIGDGLPASAQKHRSWWSNDPKAQPHSQSWLDVGWRVSNVNIRYQQVSFKRIDSRQQKYINFFSILGEKLKGVQEFSGLNYRFMNSHGRHWYTLEIVNNKINKLIWISISFATRSRLRLEIHMSKEEYALSYSKKEEIELLFGEPLSWEPLDGKQGSRVAVYKDKTNIMMDESIHHDAEEWVINKIGRFYTSIAPSLQTSTTSNLATGENQLLLDKFD
jgi:hypothetical protein